MTKNRSARKTGRNGEPSDKELVDRILTGHDASFGLLYGRYKARVFGFALRRVSNAVDAEDITQEVFLQVHRSLGSYRGRASLSTWIFGIAHNVTCRFYRRSRGQTVSLEDSEVDAKLAFTPKVECSIDATRVIQRCDAALAKSRAVEHREIFQLFYGRGRTLRVIAHSTGRPTDSVKDSLRRSRDMLMRDVPDLRSALMSVGA